MKGFLILVLLLIISPFGYFIYFEMNADEIRGPETNSYKVVFHHTTHEGGDVYRSATKVIYKNGYESYENMKDISPWEFNKFMDENHRRTK
jgi:hypothetical protein